MFSLKSDLTMTMVKDSLQKAYARNGETASYNCGESVDGKKAQVDGIAETTDIDDPEIKHLMEDYNGEKEGLPHYKEQLEEKAEQIFNGEKLNQVSEESDEYHHVVEVYGEKIDETSEQGGRANGPSKESPGENFELSKLSEETDKEELGEENLEGLPLVDKEKLEEKAEEILNKINSHKRRINSDSELINTIKRINRTTDVEIESSKTTRKAFQTHRYATK